MSSRLEFFNKTELQHLALGLNGLDPDTWPLTEELTAEVEAELTHRSNPVIGLNDLPIGTTICPDCKGKGQKLGVKQDRLYHSEPCFRCKKQGWVRL